MELVVSIPDDQYRTLNAKSQKDIVAVIDDTLLINAIKDGRPLPPAHGDLIDRKKLMMSLHHCAGRCAICKHWTIQGCEHIVNAEALVPERRENEDE